MPQIDIDLIQAQLDNMFPKLLGLKILEVRPDCIKAEMPGREEICTLPGLIHGGALMAFADTLGAIATFLNMPEGARTTTLESKTNFISGMKSHDTILGECIPIHRGKSTMVWQTRITNGDGKLGALVTQTQMVIPL